MASGGGSSGRGSSSEHRKRPKTYRVENDDLSSIGSNRQGQDDRPNNWDFSDWKPISASYDSSKRIKKGSNNPDREKEIKKERGQHSMSLDLGPQLDGGRHHTPATFPRTKMSSKTSMSQRLAMENLRQQLSFSDAEEMSADGERNNERQMVHRERLSNYMAQAAATNRIETSSNASEQTRDRNSNISRSEGPDSNEIVGRLMQIRDYIKQASSMMDNLKKSADPGDQGRAKQLNQVIQRLKEQEQKYLDLLLKLSNHSEQYTKFDTLVQHLHAQERDYLDLLENRLAAREEELLFSQNLTESVASQAESETEAESVDLDVQSDASGNTTDANEEPEGIVTSRPTIEGRLGRHSDTEVEDPPSARSSRSKESELDNTLVAEPEHADEQDAARLSELSTYRRRLETDVDQKNDELEALRQQHELLKKMLNQQEQLRALQGRQAALQALQRDAEKNMQDNRSPSNEAGAVGTSNLSPAGAAASNGNTMMVGAEGGGEPQNDMDAVPQELKDLRRRLDYLKNIYDIHGPQPGSEADEQRSINTEQSDMSLTSLERRHLSDKLRDLQDKKAYMDDLLGELNSLRRQRHPQLNNEMMDTGSITSSQGHIMESVAATTSASRTVTEAQDVLEVLESRKKLKKLQDVRGRLNQLRDLVQYYQTGTEFIHGDAEGMEGPSAPAPERSDHQQNHNISEPSKKVQVTDKLRQYASSGRDAYDRQSDMTSTQEDTSDTESHVSSSAGAWGDDPEIQDKVRKLKAAKDKLRQLQELVLKVQESPEMANALPDDLAELANSIQESSSSQAPTAPASQSRVAEIQANVSEGEVAQDSDEVYYETRMQEQKEELEQLMEERRKLLTIQEQLQKLHEQLGGAEAAEVVQEALEMEGRSQEAGSHSQGDMDGDESDTNNTRVKSVQETSQVTFQEPPEVVQSYDELYGRMRQQRMLREELREKKKELEFMMSKDRPRKQYSRNQDNQSDNISFSNKSDPLGTKSEDYTMATWGGSTVDNLESIEEDENGSGAGQGPEEADADDGYPSDGIVQVEEEEEAQESDDHDTYTIEDELTSRVRLRQSALPKRTIAEGGAARGRRRRTRRGAPLMDEMDGERNNYEYNFWAPDKSKVLNNARSRRRSPRSKREKSDSALEKEVRELRQSLDELRSQMSQAGSPAPLSSNSFALRSSNFPTPLVAQMQQQLLLNLSQSYQQLCLNQHESSDRLRRLETYFVRSESAADDNQVRREPLDYQAHLMMNSPGGSSSNPYRVHPSPDAPGSFSQRLANSGMSADSYLQQYRAARARAVGGPDSQLSQPFRFDGRPYNFDAEAFLENPGAYAAARGYGDHQGIQGTLSQEVQTEEIISEMSAAASESSVPNGGARPKQRVNSMLQEQGSLRGNVRGQTTLGNLQNEMSASEYSPLGTARTTARSDTSKAESIQIDTILASDRSSRRPIPPLDLATGWKNRYPVKEIASEVSTVASSRSDAVVGRKFPTPSRASAASRLASRQLAGQRPGLSAGICGTAFMDASSMASMSSAVSSVPGAGSVDAVARAQGTNASIDSRNVELDSDATISDFTMFEALRETIYAEVATLISQNEMRPHYLIELFRELQMMTTDYLRQRTLYVIQDLVTRHLTEEDTQSNQPDKESQPSSARKMHWPKQANRVLSEHTPSESQITSDEEEIKAQLYARTLQRRGPPDLPMDQGSVSGSVKSDRFDYAEPVDTTSSLSTPTSSNYLDHDHFAKDSLGDTVIHLDKALERMREYERRVAAVEAVDAENMKAKTNKRSGASGGKAAEGATSKDQMSEVASSSAQGSDTSNSDVPYPRIDTQQLDRQIKGIMTEVLPVLKEHMDEVCSQNLLQYVRRLVLSLTKHQDDQHEFARFFHKQLGSIVQDSLAKFEGRKMRECGEDMLVELSEILFNELAFFRLMQDLDDPKAKVKARVKASVKDWHQDGGDSLASNDTGVTKDDDECDGQGGERNDTTSAADSSESESEQNIYGLDREDVEADTENTDQQEEEEEDDSESDSEYSNETDDLGKQARDDELAAQMEIAEKDDDSESPHKSPVKIELAVSEIKSFTRIGSDEDDEGEDEVQSADDVSETAVSRDIHNEAEASNGATSEDTKVTAVEESPALTQKEETEEEEDIEEEIEGDENNGDEEDDDEVTEEVTTDTDPADSASGKIPEKSTESSVGEGAVMNGEVGRLLQVYNVYLYSVPPDIHNGEGEGEVTLDDLPKKLIVLGPDQKVVMEEKKAAEDQENAGVAAALENLDGAAAGAELAGDANALKEPVVDRPSPTVELGIDNVLYLTARDGSAMMLAGLQMRESQA